MAVSVSATAATTVLRVKRKRTEDPFNVLVIHTGSAKKKKQNAEDISEETQKCLFTFAGTIKEKNVKPNDDVFNKLRTKDMYKQIELSEKIKCSQRKLNKEKQQLSRYKVLSEVRKMKSNSDENEEEEEDEIKRLFNVYDVVSDDMKSEIKEPKSESKIDDILCNSVKMIRETLNITDNATNAQDSDYVYDLYFTPTVLLMNDEILNVEEYSEEMVLYYDQVVDNEECYDDEDDENAESNWRNDYPDEDDYDNSSSEDEDFVYDGYRKGTGRTMFDPYAATYDPEDYYHTVAKDDDYDDNDD